MSLDSKVVLVTGGASGIGRATANRLAQDGAHVVVADIQAELAEEVVSQVKNDGGSAEVCDLDVAAEGAAAEAVAHGSDTCKEWRQLPPLSPLTAD
ncbi:MAG: SDR family NAD(P)-dependent oxidoreductase [Gammaproteobacteria bacterium]